LTIVKEFRLWRYGLPKFLVGEEQPVSIERTGDAGLV
jgi:hypothetical protein